MRRLSHACVYREMRRLSHACVYREMRRLSPSYNSLPKATRSGSSTAESQLIINTVWSSDATVRLSGLRTHLYHLWSVFPIEACTLAISSWYAFSACCFDANDARAHSMWATPSLDWLLRRPVPWPLRPVPWLLRPVSLPVPTDE